MPRALPSVEDPVRAPDAACSDETALLAAWQQSRDRKALAALIARHIGRIRQMARRSSRALREDLETEGVLALIDAASRYPISGPAPFAAFAFPAVRFALIRARAGHGSVVSIPERQLRDALAGRGDQTRGARIREALQPEAFDETALLHASPATEETALQRERHHRLRHALAGALRPLGREERRLVLHHLLHEDRELPMLAEALNISVARARSLEGRALHKMRNTLMNRGFMMSDLT